MFPSRQDLDAVVRDRPVVLQRVDGHAVVVNSKALEIAGITRATPDPEGGQILRDPATGEPTGILVDNAMDLVWRHVPPETDEALARNLEAGAAAYVRLGWTEMQYAGTSWRAIDQLCRLYAAGKVKLRVYAAIGGPGEDAEKLLAAGRDYKSCDPRLTVRTIKLFMDGALGSRGAALDEPYSDAPGNRGLYVTPPEEILRIATAALRRGIQVETHAIGDRGNRVVLDQYEKALAAVPAAERPVADPRFRIEHAQVVADADIPRFAKLGVIASMQTSHAISDMLFAPARLGPARIGGAYAWRKFLDAGATIAGGTDAPVEAGDPRVEFYAAVARRTLEGFAGPDWGLDQRLTRDEALAILTKGAAYAAFQEQDRGTIEPGKLADFSVYSADWMQVPEAEIPRSQAVMTVIARRDRLAGALEFRRPTAPSRWSATLKRPVAVSRSPCAWALRSSARRAANGICGHVLERSRAGEQETLAGDAAELEQLRHLLLVLDAFGDRLEAERLAEHHDRARELRPVVLLGQPARRRSDRSSGCRSGSDAGRTATSSPCRSRRSRGARRAPSARGSVPG